MKGNDVDWYSRTQHDAEPQRIGISSRGSDVPLHYAVRRIIEELALQKKERGTSPSFGKSRACKKASLLTSMNRVNKAGCIKSVLLELAISYVANLQDRERIERRLDSVNKRKV